MDNIFMAFFDLFMNIWQVSGELMQPLISFITNFAGVMIPVLTNLATFLLNAVDGIISFIQSIIQFFTGSAESISQSFGEGIGGGGGMGGI